MESAALASGPLLAAADTDSWVAVNRAWKNGSSVWRDPASGDFSLTGRSGWKELRRPRIGLYRSWMPNMDEGWTRWLFEQFGFAYTSLHNADIQAGGLRQRFDVLVFADQSSRNIDTGYANALPAEYLGGLGPKGADTLREFAAAGGTLVFLNHASDYAIEHLGVTATAVTGAAGFYSPGSLLNIHLDTRHPLAYGVPGDLAIWSEQSPAWDTQLPVVARYTDANVLASGWLEGEKVIAGRAAIIDAPVGSGHIVLFGMRPQYRGQSYLTFKMFFNALLLNAS
jgi:hypothetical protein